MAFSEQCSLSIYDAKNNYVFKKKSTKIDAFLPVFPAMFIGACDIFDYMIPYRDETFPYCTELKHFTEINSESCPDYFTVKY